MYFSVVPEGFGDEEPVVQIDLSQNGTQVDSNTITITGNVVDGAEQGDVVVEIALEESSFYESAVKKYELDLALLWNKSADLGNGDGFELTLDISDKYTNVTDNVTVYIMVYEGDDKRWQTIQFIKFRALACQGELPPIEVVDAEPDAYWIWEDGECVWSGEWTWKDADGNEITPQGPKEADDSAESSGNTIMFIGIGVGVLLIVILSLFFVLRGGGEEVEITVGGDFNAAAAGYAGVAEMDPMEQYVQQLIAQGYPEETARAYAQQYAGHFQQQ